MRHRSPFKHTRTRVCLREWWWLKTRRLRDWWNPEVKWHWFTGHWTPSEDGRDVCLVCDNGFLDHSPAAWCPHLDLGEDET